MLKRYINKFKFQYTLFVSISLINIFTFNACHKNKVLDNYALNKIPIKTYISNLDTGISLTCSGSFRILELEKQNGVNPTSINSFFEIPEHNINSDSGTLTLWFFSLEELSPFVDFGNMKMHNQHIKTYPFLSDFSNPQNFDSANFKLIWDAGWHPNLIALFAKGKLYEDAYNHPHRAIVTANHFQFQKLQWYQIALTWNHPAKQLRLYVNGILVGAENQFYPYNFHRDSCGKSLFFGNPTLCYSHISFYNEVLDKKEIYNSFRTEVPQFDEELEHELKHVYEGKNRKMLSFKPDENWKKKLNLSFTKQSDLDNFYIQGNPVDVSITNEGLLVETIHKQYNSALLDSQVYLWSNKVFEGDLYVEYEFKSLRRGGLSLLMTQASGMNREDFMKDYPLRTSGRMSMVCWQDLRNYHWEYFREMADVRNDVASSAMMKNPFMTPIGYGCMEKQLEPNTWHKLQFLQRGNHIIGAIDGVIMIDAVDNGMSNNGPVLDYGRIALRCMLNTKMMFRNLKVYNGKTKFNEIKK